MYNDNFHAAKFIHGFSKLCLNCWKELLIHFILFEWGNWKLYFFVTPIKIVLYFLMVKHSNLGRLFSLLLKSFKVGYIEIYIFWGLFFPLTRTKLFFVFWCYECKWAFKNARLNFWKRGREGNLINNSKHPTHSQGQEMKKAWYQQKIKAEKAGEFVRKDMRAWKKSTCVNEGLFSGLQSRNIDFKGRLKRNWQEIGLENWGLLF